MSPPNATRLDCFQWLNWKLTRSHTNVAVRLQGQYFNPFIIWVIMSANDLTSLKGMSVIKSFLYLTEHLFLKATIGWGAKEIFINVLEMALTKRI